MDNKQETINSDTTLILSQSYDPGWIAVTPTTNFPYLTPVGKHVMVNNWSNGWQLTPSTINDLPSTIYIFFWPQFLEFLGFALLPLPFLLARKLASTR